MRLLQDKALRWDLLFPIREAWERRQFRLTDEQQGLPKGSPLFIYQFFIFCADIHADRRDRSRVLEAGAAVGRTDTGRPEAAGAAVNRTDIDRPEKVEAAETNRMDRKDLPDVLPIDRVVCRETYD